MAVGGCTSSLFHMNSVGTTGHIVGYVPSELGYVPSELGYVPSYC